MTPMKRLFLTVLAFVGGLAVVAGIVGLAYFMIPKGHAYSHSVEHEFPTKPFVTDEPVDQKQNMGMYDDAKGPSWANMPMVGAVRMPWGTCYKPGVSVTFDEHGNAIYAEDNEVIWRCAQSHPTGEPADAPIVYCHQQREQPSHLRFGLAWRCYHDYSIVFDFYEHEYGKSPLILPDEIEYIDTTEIR